MTDIPSRSVVWASKPCGVAIHGVKNQTRSCPYSVYSSSAESSEAPLSSSEAPSFPTPAYASCRSAAAALLDVSSPRSARKRAEIAARIASQACVVYQPVTISGLSLIHI